MNTNEADVNRPDSADVVGSTPKRHHPSSSAIIGAKFRSMIDNFRAPHKAKAGLALSGLVGLAAIQAVPVFAADAGVQTPQDALQDMGVTLDQGQQADTSTDSNLDALKQLAPDVIGDLNRDNVTIKNLGTTHRINSVNFLAISQAAKNHGHKVEVDFYDSLDQTLQYQNLPRIRGAVIEGHSHFAGGDTERRVYEATGQSIPTFYFFTTQMPDGSIRLEVILGDRFDEFYNTPEYQALAEQGIALQIATAAEFGAVDVRTLAGRTYSSDTRGLIGAAADQSAIRVYPLQAVDAGSAPSGDVVQPDNSTAANLLPADQ